MMAFDQRQSATVEANDHLPTIDGRPIILCIDDDPDISRTIELRLRSYEVTVLRAFHGMQGFWLAMTEQPSLVITDINMPQGRGDYIVECLKRNTETQNIPVIVLSGSRDETTKAELIKLGAERYFTKPCESEALIDAIKSFVHLEPVEEYDS
jgi:DNA-binding response OmpR family regulator